MLFQRLGDKLAKPLVNLLAPHSLREQKKAAPKRVLVGLRRPPTIGFTFCPKLHIINREDIVSKVKFVVTTLYGNEVLFKGTAWTTTLTNSYY